jgi:hypothetical protein
MLIEYRANRMQRNVRDSAARFLIANRIARAVESRQMRAEAGDTVAPEISPRTGLPKRQYRRRDMVAEA